MENLSRTSRRHTSKLINNGGLGGVLAKTLYDDVYGGPPKFSSTSLSPRLEDYTEIFGSSRAAAASSIPFLDLPAVDHDDFFDCRSSSFDFSEVFGGFDELDFAVAYDDVAKNGGGGGDSSDEAWTSAGSGSGESNHSLKNTSFFYGDPYYSFDGSSEFGISYNKALKKSNKESLNRRTRVNPVPAASENRYVSDEISLTRQKKSDNKSFQAADDTKFNMYSAVEVANESLLRKTVNGSSGEQAYGDSSKTERESGKKGSRHKEPFVDISDINPRTQTSHLPPPCRLPPLVDGNSRDSGRLSSNSNTVSSHERTCDISPPVYDVEVDSSSSASVSAAAMKEAMEKARVQLRSAKELMQKRRSKCRSMKESQEERKVGKFDGSSNKKDDRVERKSEREDCKFNFSVSEEKQKVLKKVREDSESSESAKNLVQEKHVKGSWSSQGSIEIDEACEWQEATQYFELVALDDTKKAFELTNEDEILVQITNSDENVVDIEAHDPEDRHKESYQWEGLENRKETSELEEKERRLEEAFFIQAENEKRLKEDFEQEENEKRLKEAQQQVETEKEAKKAQDLQEKEVKKAQELQEKEVKKAQELQEKEINLQQALEQEKKKIQKEAALREENEKRLKQLIEKEEIKMRLKEENEKRLKKARQMQENEKRIKEALEQENKMRQKEVAERQENEKRLKEALEFEEYQNRQKDDREREENERRLKMEALEFEENQKRQKDDREREENEPRLKMVDASEQQIALNRLNESQGRAFKQAEIHQKLDDASLLEQTRKNIKVADDKEVDVLNITQAGTERNVDVQEPMSVKGTHLPVAVKDHKLSDETCNQECSANNQATQIGRNHDENSEKESSDNKISRTMSGTEVAESVNVSLDEHVPSDPSVNKATEEVVTEPRVTKGENGRVTMTNGPVDEQFKAPRLSSWAEESTESGSSGTDDAYESLPFVDFVKKAVEASCGSETPQPKCNSSSQKDSDHTSQNMEDNLAAEPVKEFVDSRKKKEAAYSSMGDLNHWKSSQQVNGSQAPGRKVENLKEDKLNGEKVTERLKRERELESDRRMKMEEEREREREREKDRMDVDRATLEARDWTYVEVRERAEKVASERATADARQRAMAEARERLEKACAEARERSLAGKAAMEAKLKMERAAVERATLEARERAAAKLMAERDRIQRSVSDKFSASSRANELRHCSSSSDLQGPQISRQSYSRAYGEKCEGDEAESAQRCKARLERHARTAERAAKALADKNMRDLLAQREQAERNRLAETLDADVKRWSSGKEGNLRALLSTLQYILGSDSGWQPIHMTEVITAAAVKKAYRKATLCVHPDKLQQRGASIHQKYICEKVFDLLKEAWNRFNSEER